MCPTCCQVQCCVPMPVLKLDQCRQLLRLSYGTLNLLYRDSVRGSIRNGGTRLRISRCSRKSKMTGSQEQLCDGCVTCCRRPVQRGPSIVTPAQNSQL